MKSSWILPVLLIGSCPCVGSAAEFKPDQSTSGGSWGGHASYVAGWKQLSSDWAPVEGQVEFGLIDLDLTPPKWPVSLCAQVLMTYADAPPDVPGSRGDYSGVWEINLGVRKIVPVSSVINLFGGGGIAFTGASASSWIDLGDGFFQDYEDSGYGVGWWGSGGAYWNLSDHWHLGVQFQYSWGEVELFDHRANAGGFHALGMVGYHW